MRSSNNKGGRRASSWHSNRRFSFNFLQTQTQLIIQQQLHQSAEHPTGEQSPLASQLSSPTHLYLAVNTTLYQLVPKGKAKKKEQKKKPQVTYLDSKTRYFQLLFLVLRPLQEDSGRTRAIELVQASLTMTELCCNVMNDSSLHNRDAEKEGYSENKQCH